MRLTRPIRFPINLTVILGLRNKRVRVDLLLIKPIIQHHRGDDNDCQLFNNRSNSAEKRSGIPSLAPQMNSVERLAKLRFEARAENLQEARDLVRRAVLNKGYASATINGIVLAVDEACSNIIRHGYGEGKTGDIILEILFSQDELIFRLTDFAAQVDKTKLRSRDLDDLRPGGLGVHLIKQVMDSFEYLDVPQGAGNVLELRKKVAPP